MKLCFSSLYIYNRHFSGNKCFIQMPSISGTKSYEAPLCCLVFGSTLSLKIHLWNRANIYHHMDHDSAITNCTRNVIQGQSLWNNLGINATIKGTIITVLNLPPKQTLSLTTMIYHLNGSRWRVFVGYHRCWPPQFPRHTKNPIGFFPLGFILLH